MLCYALLCLVERKRERHVSPGSHPILPHLYKFPSLNPSLRLKKDIILNRIMLRSAKMHVLRIRLLNSKDLYSLEKKNLSMVFGQNVIFITIQ